MTNFKRIGKETSINPQYSLKGKKSRNWYRKRFKKSAQPKNAGKKTIK